MLTYADPGVPAPPAALTAPLPRPARPGLPARALRLHRRVWPRLWPWLRLLGGAAILAVVVWRVGTGGFLAAVRVIDGGTLLAAFAIGVATTVLSAWRWCLIARGLGIRLPLARAAGDYYRALFLNAALPGGVLGDVHRAVRNGRDTGDLGRGVRAVVLERFAGQVVLIGVGVAVLLALPGRLPVLERLAGPRMLLAAALVAATALAAAGLGRRLARAGTGTRWGRAWHTGVASLRRGLLAREVWPGVLLASVSVLAGYLATFLVAARAAGVTAPTTTLLPLLVLALFAMALPVNVGGWGPREGACAWAFAAAGLGAAQGVTVAVIYGVSVFVASLPGAVVLVARWVTDRRGDQRVEPAPAAAQRVESA